MKFKIVNNSQKCFLSKGKKNDSNEIIKKTEIKHNFKQNEMKIFDIKKDEDILENFQSQLEIFLWEALDDFSLANFSLLLKIFIDSGVDNFAFLNGFLQNSVLYFST